MVHTSGDEAATAHPGRTAAPILELCDAGLAYGNRFLWQHLDLAIQPGEFIAVLGANGSGKTSLLRAILGEQALSTGTIRVAGRPVRRGGRQVAYVPQRVSIDQVTPIRARDLVRLGLDGHRWGPGLLTAARARHRVDALLESVGARDFAEAPVSLLSGGELQRVRIAEALAGDPALLLCDEPLAALDLAQAQTVVSLLDGRRRERGTAILFVTHDINAVLDVADRVLYLAGGRFRLGAPAEVLTSAGLTTLYGAPVDVFHTQGRVIVVAASDPGAGVHGPHHEHHADHGGTPAPAHTGGAQ
jgi:zinc/manganese transport system ATP-binding protein